VQVYRFAVAIFWFALLFWAWALKNTVALDANVGFDGGLVSFGTVLLTSCLVIGSISSSTSMHNASTAVVVTRTTQRLVLVSHLLVALNYGVGCIAGFFLVGRIGLGIYCLVFTLLWIGIALYGKSLFTKATSTTTTSNDSSTTANAANAADTVTNGTYQETNY
jgi:hypothetical protein